VKAMTIAFVFMGGLITFASIVIKIKDVHVIVDT